MRRYDEKYTPIHIETLKTYSKLSKAKRLQCSAILVTNDNKRVLAVGYNGTPEGYSNECEFISKAVCKNCGAIYYESDEEEYTESTFFDFVKEFFPICENCGYDQDIKSMNTELKSRKSVVHAEANLISFCAKEGISMKDKIMYITHSPCMECAKLIVSSGVSMVFYIDDYRDMTGVEFLKDCYVNVIKLNMKDSNEKNS